MPVVALLTDFGTADGYAAEMKGVLSSLAPGTALVDIAHDVAPGDVEAAAWVLGRVWRRFPPGCVFLAVVDPGVGGDRRAVAAQIDARWFVGPDNGLASRVLETADARLALAIDPGRIAGGPVSPTFHGRDLFAPATAALSVGREPVDLGPALDPSTLRRLPSVAARRTGRAVRGAVAHVDRFGNLITNIPAAAVGPSALVEVGGIELSGIRATYEQVAPGRLVALIGSGGTLEIALRGGSAAGELGVGRGAEVSVRSERD